MERYLIQFQSENPLENEYLQIIKTLSNEIISQFQRCSAVRYVCKEVLMRYMIDFIEKNEPSTKLKYDTDFITDSLKRNDPRTRRVNNLILNDVVDTDKLTITLKEHLLLLETK